jgi:hypothetical protein
MLFEFLYIFSCCSYRYIFTVILCHIYLPPFCLHKSINLPQFASHAVASFSALHLLKHCKLYAAHPTALPAGPDAESSFFASHPQHFFGSSVFTSAFAHAQQSALGGCG